MDEPREISKTYRVQRWHGGGTGCHGSESLYDVQSDGRIGHSGLQPGALLGRDLPENTIVKVTVEIVQDGDGWGVGPHPSHFRPPISANYSHAADCPASEQGVA